MCRSFASLAIVLSLFELTPSFAQKDSPLNEAVEKSDVQAIRQLLEQGANINAQGINGNTPLHLAQTPEIVELLLQKKPVLTIRDRWYQLTPMQLTAYHHAQANNDEKRIRYRNLVDSYLKTGIECDPICAIYLNDPDTLKARLFKSPKLADNFHDKSLLRIAASVGRTEICKFLLENYKVDVNDFKRGNGFSILVYAVPYPNIVQLLIKHKADVQKPMSDEGLSIRAFRQQLIGSNFTALHFAVLKGVPETITLLLDANIDPFVLARSDHNKKKFLTALEVAAIVGRLDTAKAILDHPRFNAAPIKTRLDILDKCIALTVDPQWLSLDPQRFKLVLELIRHGANPKAKLDGKSVLQLAFHGLVHADEKDEADLKLIIPFLRKQGAAFTLLDAVTLHEDEAVQGLIKFEPQCVNDPRPDGDTPLHLAIRQNDKDIVKQLLEADANVNPANNRKATPLHDACRRNHVNYAELLLEKGANPDACDRDNKTPLDLVKADGYYNPAEMVKLFEKYRKKK